MRALAAAVLFALVTCSAIADEVWFAGEERPHLGEVLEKTPRALIIKFPRDQIRAVKTAKPLEVTAWRERRILWQDTGDYVVLSLPKGRMAHPEDPEKGEPARLTRSLATVGEQGFSPLRRATGTTGRVVGRLLSRDGRPLARWNVLLACVGGDAAEDLVDAGSPPGSRTTRPPRVVTDAKGGFTFEEVPPGQYDVYWRVAGESQWTRKLSEKPNLTVRAGETVRYKDIRTR